MIAVILRCRSDGERTSAMLGGAADQWAAFMTMPTGQRCSHTHWRIATVRRLWDADGSSAEHGDGVSGLRRQLRSSFL